MCVFWTLTSFCFCFRFLANDADVYGSALVPERLFCVAVQRERWIPVLLAASLHHVCRLLLNCDAYVYVLVLQLRKMIGLTNSLAAYSYFRCCLDCFDAVCLYTEMWVEYICFPLD